MFGNIRGGGADRSGGFAIQGENSPLREHQESPGMTNRDSGLHGKYSMDFYTMTRLDRFV
jgi:hypothetical protein